MAIFETGALRGAKCCRRLRGSTLRRAFHGLTPTAKCCRRLRGSVGTPGPALGDYHYLNRRPSGVWQFLRQGLSVRLSAAAAFAAQHCAELSMGLRPRLPADAAFAAFWNPRTDSRGIINEKSCPCSARGPSYPPPPLGGEEPFFLLVFLRVPSWSFVPLRGYLFVLCAPSWIEYRRFLPLVRNESLLLPVPFGESPEFLLDFRLGGVAGVDVDPVEEAEGLSLG